MQNVRPVGPVVHARPAKRPIVLTPISLPVQLQRNEQPNVISRPIVVNRMSIKCRQSSKVVWNWFINNNK